MIDVAFDAEKLENKLKIFSAGLGSFYASLMRGVGDKIADEARARAPVNTGQLRDSIGFLMRGRFAALTTRERFGKNTLPYAWAVHNNRTNPQPFALPVWRSYWSGKNAKGYRELANELQRKMREELS